MTAAWSFSGDRNSDHAVPTAAISAFAFRHRETKKAHGNHCAIVHICTYIVYVVHSYAHTFPYSHAALLCFVVHYSSVLFLLLSLPPPLSVVPTWLSCQPCCVSLTPCCSQLSFTRSSNDDVVWMLCSFRLLC